MGMGMGMGGGGGFGMGGGIGGFLIFSKFTHLCRLYFPILIDRTSPFLILGLLDGIFHFYSKFKKPLFANSAECGCHAFASVHCCLVLRYSVLFTVESLSLLYLLVIS